MCWPQLAWIGWWVNCAKFLFFSPGMIIGLLIKYLSRNKRVEVTYPNCTISAARKKLYISTSNGSQYSYTLSGAVQNSGQESELEQMVGTMKNIYMLMIS